MAKKKEKTKKTELSAEKQTELNVEALVSGLKFWFKLLLVTPLSKEDSENLKAFLQKDLMNKDEFEQVFISVQSHFTAKQNRIISNRLKKHLL